MTPAQVKERRAAYGIWYMMHDRCENEANKFYHRYGGRGIKVCKRWSDFQTFMNDMWPRPKGHSLERKDGNKGYSPGNVTWADRRSQAGNTINCVHLKFRGETRIMSDWSQVTGLSVHLISQRLSQGWSIKRALSTPAASKRKNVLIEFRGEKKTAAQWSKLCGIPGHRILTRLRQGYSKADAITLPLRTRLASKDLPSPPC